MLKYNIFIYNVFFTILIHKILQYLPMIIILNNLFVHFRHLFQSITLIMLVNNLNNKFPHSQPLNLTSCCIQCVTIFLLIEYCLQVKVFFWENFYCFNSVINRLIYGQEVEINRRSGGAKRYFGQFDPAKTAEIN